MNANFKKEVIDRSIEDIQVELDDQFDQNFERKSFMGEEKWPDAKAPNSRGSLMLRTGGLRGSIRSRRRNSTLVYSSTKPQAQIHNEGGEIKVTKKMRGYFMYRYCSIRGRYGKRKDGSRRKDKRNESLSEEESFYFSMAKKKVGSTVKIPKRQYIGSNKKTDKIIREIVNENLERYIQDNPIIKSVK
ncbi:MAG: phage virion morphogenesis protein [Rikenellaceae bacterium]